MYIPGFGLSKSTFHPLGTPAVASPDHIRSITAIITEIFVLYLICRHGSRSNEIPFEFFAFFSPINLGARRRQKGENFVLSEPRILASDQQFPTFTRQQSFCFDFPFILWKSPKNSSSIDDYTINLVTWHISMSVNSARAFLFFQKVLNFNGASRISSLKSNYGLCASCFVLFAWITFVWVFPLISLGQFLLAFAWIYGSSLNLIFILSTCEFFRESSQPKRCNGDIFGSGKAK